MKLKQVLFLMGMALLVACGSSSSSDSGGGGNNTFPTITGVRIKGKLASITTTSINKATGLKTTKTATTVVVSNPTTGASTCKTATIEEDGEFTVDIKNDVPALVTIVDDTQVGEEMTVAHITIEEQGLDVIPPNNVEGEEVDFGTLTVADELATSDKEGATLVTELGNTEATATNIGEVDDIATRFVNADVDNNGELDCVESTATPDAQGNKGVDFMLDFHVRFDLEENGTAVTVADIIGDYFSATATSSNYLNTGIYASYLKTFSSAETGSVTFEQAVTTSEGGAIAAGVPTSSVTTNPYGDYNGYGVNVTSDSELPYGKIIFTEGGQNLTFTDIVTPSLSVLNTMTGRIFPFVKFALDDPTCTSSCTLASFSYKWMKSTGSGWEKASLSELRLLLKSTGATLSFRVDGDANKYVSFTIPKPDTDDTIEGTVTWSAANASYHEGVTDAELEGLFTSQICHVGLSYDDQIGMRYFENVANVAGTCSQDVS